jgi:uncharacterized LabA/DUF88 family protein
LRTYVYIDGYNLYYGLKQLCGDRGPWRWLDLEKWVKSQSPHDFEICRVRYFTANVKPSGWQKAKRQKKFIRAVKSNPKASVHLGNYETRESQYPLRDDPGTKVWVMRTEEKQTDVNLACHMILDALVRDDEPVEAAIVVSNDSDLTYPVKVLREAGVPVGILNPHPERPSGELREIASWYRLARAQKVFDAQLPDEVADEHGIVLRPVRWGMPQEDAKP